MTPIQRMMLDMEKRHYRYAGSKEQAIRDELDVAPARYYQLLAALIDEPEALAAEPVLVNRLRRIAHSRRHIRKAG
ncbi:DUF3263 domain-containing protein [Rhodococcoides corynebacterioides]|uniref:DUF3263 domain-containing protein n=1 Tax=Rhodococcoides corynebacterioides TaxID=53972 RepID=UPI003F81897C